eukprot:SAG31_NODE_480_length_15108_cov_56.073423_10_plen_673_part_00
MARAQMDASPLRTRPMVEHPDEQRQADPDVPMPDFGLTAVGALLRGDTSALPGGAEPSNTQQAAPRLRQTTLRERLLLAVLLIYPVAATTQPLWYPELFARSRSTVFFAVCFGFFVAITTVASFRSICVVTHPHVIVERLGGAFHSTKQGHITRLIAEQQSARQSSVVKLHALKKRLVILTVALSCISMGVGVVSVADAYRRNEMKGILGSISFSLFVPVWCSIFCTWLFSLRVATTLTSAAMHARAEQAGALAKTVQKPPKARTIFGSMRFPVPPEARQLQKSLAREGITLHIVEARAGDDISDEVFEWIEHADSFLVFGTHHYGEDTGNPASSCAEAKYAQYQGKRIILLRMIPWEQEFDHLQARVMFGQNKLTLDWQIGAAMPPLLCEQIVRALELTGEAPRESDGSWNMPLAGAASPANMSNAMIDDAEWRAVVEAPALRLANTILPTLSAGWGPSVGWVTLGCEVGAFASCITTYELGAFGAVLADAREGDWGQVCYWVALWSILILLPMLLPFTVVKVGEISTACKRVEDSIHAYCVEDLRMHRLVHPLSTALRNQNRGQGLGFTVFNHVATERSLCAAISILWFVGLQTVPALIHEVEELTSPAISNHPACPNTWQFVDEKCFMLFGRGASNGNGKPLKWSDAERACQVCACAVFCHDSVHSTMI